jgi:nicotinamide mononucleotide adenylyltransferase
VYDKMIDFILIIESSDEQNALYLYNMADKVKPVFNKRIFWDVVFENIDYDAKANFVIERVFERGDVEDIRNCRRYYGDEKVAQALLNAKFLPEITMYLASAVINKPLKDFRCYILRQLNPALFPY